jgi:quercetin dioxygenase-like cupin family protein
MPHPTTTPDEMQKRIVRFAELRECGIPLMFIDSILPRHYRMNFAVVGDTASENPDFQPILTQPHKFQIGMVNAPPGCGPAYHTHDYIELFFVLSGRWRYYWGNDPETPPEGEAVLDVWDMISLPPGLWRGFENVSAEPAWLLAVLEPHEVFAGKDPYWAPQIVRQAAQYGFQADERGKMIKPDDYEEQRRRVEAQLLPGVQAPVA